MKKFFLATLLASSLSTYAGNDNWHLGARSASMAHSSVTLFDVWSTHHNQAGLAWLNNPVAGAYFENRFTVRELSQMGVSFAYPIKAGTFGVSYSGFGYSLYKENKVGLGYGMKFNDRISGGVQMNYHSLRIANDYGTNTSFSVEAGIMARITDEFTVGVHVFNPTKAKLIDYNDERIPTIMRLGVGYKFSDKILVTAEAEKDIDYDASFRAGLEYSATENFFLRGGVSTNPGIMAFGFGFQFDGFKADLATTYHQILGFSPQISLQYTFQRDRK